MIMYSLLCVANNCKESSVRLLAAAFLSEVREDVCKEVKSCMILSVAVRHHDHGDPLAPRVAREKRGASRLNLSSDKNRSVSGRGRGGRGERDGLGGGCGAKKGGRC